jgi:PTH2 family peptidyl-tRNA hydrolase
MSEIKQVVVVRGDLNCRRGKENVQVGHAVIAFLLHHVRYKTKLSKVEKEWLDENKQAKICLQVDSEEGLLQIYDQAKAADLEVHLITDAGLTEFDGPTKTCLAIGPDYSEKIDKITGHLKLR